MFSQLAPAGLMDSAMPRGGFILKPAGSICVQRTVHALSLQRPPLQPSATNSLTDGPNAQSYPLFNSLRRNRIISDTESSGLVEIVECIYSFEKEIPY